MVLPQSSTRSGRLRYEPPEWNDQNAMKHVLFLSAPLFAFFAAAMLAGLMPPYDPAASPDQTIPTGPRKRAGVIEDSKPALIDIESTLAEMERRVVRFHSAQAEVCAADGMESG